MMKRLLVVAAVLTLSPLARALADYEPVKVECWSDAGCQNTTLNDICNSFYNRSLNKNMLPIVDCSQTAWSSGYNWPDYSPYNDTRSCGSATCEPIRTLSWDAPLGAFCRDTGGFDAVVYCPVY
jgi:hypothetical protein